MGPVYQISESVNTQSNDDVPACIVPQKYRPMENQFISTNCIVYILLITYNGTFNGTYNGR